MNDSEDRIVEYNGVSFCVSDGHITGVYTGEGKYIPRAEFSKYLRDLAKSKELGA